MKRHSMGRAPDYTNAALVTGGINLFILLLSVWAVVGFLPAVLLGIGLNHLITWLTAR